MSEFYVEFDLLDGHSPGTGAELSDIVLQPYGWRSIGDPGGAVLKNATGTTIRAIHIATNDPSNTFRVDANSLGRLFDKVWFREDGSAAYFVGGNIPDETMSAESCLFWMRLPANTREEIDACNQGTACPFVGQALQEDPEEPDGEGWVSYVRDVGPDPLWANIRRATPSQYRQIQAYGQDDQTGRVLFVSKGRLFLYTPENESVEPVSQPAKTQAPVNRITFDGNEFLLWDCGAIQNKIAVK